MIVHFGLHLDGMQPAAPVTTVGEATLGPARMLDVLELRLGLPPARSRPGEALVAYQRCLADLDDLARFYHRSFHADPYGVARTLLRWRAQWHEAGWRGRFAQPVSQRLADMAEVEAAARGRVPLDHGQRLQRIAQRLEQGFEPGIERVILHGELGALPTGWRALLACFFVQPAEGVWPADGDPRTAAGRARARAGTDLHVLQQTLLERAHEGAALEPRDLRGDGSFVVVRGVSRDLSAQLIAEHLLQRNAPDETLLIAERDGVIVDNALERVGLARAGFQHYSRFRAMTQVLKLCLALVWKPVNPHLLLQFLIHPVGPLPAYARARLADAVAEEPGVGGHAWRAALDDIGERQRAARTVPRDGTDATSSTDDGERAARELLAEIDYWLCCERWAPSPGAPIEVLIERARRCTAWLARRLHALREETEIDLFAAAEAQGEALIACLVSLRDAGTRTVERTALEQLVDEVSSPAPDPATFAQAGHVRAAREAGAVTEPWRTVIWWDLAAPPRAAGYPWSFAELEELTAEGVALTPAAELVRAGTREWLRPVLNARERLVLAVHDRDEGHHPLWSRITGLLRGYSEVHVEQHLLEAAGDDPFPALHVPTEPLPARPLPVPRRWWQLPEDCRPPPRAKESFSSLSKLIHHPYQWVLSYPARLHAGRASNLAAGNLLYGKLAHRLFEVFFGAALRGEPVWGEERLTLAAPAAAAAAPPVPGVRIDWPRLDAAAVAGWLERFLPELVAREGALLCEPGNGVTRAQVMVTLEGAFLRLLEHLRAAGVEQVAAEHYTEAPFAGGLLCGTIDLLLRDRRGRDIVLDVKWGQEERRGEELANSEHLQLATYAWLSKTATGAARWPYQAYFIVSTGNVLAPDASVFPDALEFRPAEGATPDAVWARMVAAMEWRRAQLATGLVEVTVEGTQPTDLSAPPAEALPPAREPARFDDYVHVAGWEAGA